MDATVPSNAANTSSDQLSPRRHRVTMLLTIALVLYWLIAFLGTHLPIPAGVIARGGGDKSLHLAGYAILAALLLGLRASRGPFGWSSVVRRWLVLALYGGVDEVTQIFVGRHADVLDWCADMVGATCGFVLVMLLVRICSRWAVKQ